MQHFESLKQEISSIFTILPFMKNLNVMLGCVELEKCFITLNQVFAKRRVHISVCPSPKGQ